MIRRVGMSTPKREWNLRVEEADGISISYADPLSLVTATIAMKSKKLLECGRTIKSIIKSMQYVNNRNGLRAKRETGCGDGTVDILNSFDYTLSKITPILSSEDDLN
jgi:hypothetical protein